jgi:hypothetical protein
LFANWCADRALDVERVALELHHNSRRPLSAEFWLRVAENAEDVRLWIDRHGGGWRDLRRARETARARRGGPGDVGGPSKFESEAMP